jgi:hypothetical protein
MRVPGFLRRLLGSAPESSLMQILTPTMAADRSTGTKLVLAGATVFGLAIAGAVAAASMVSLLLALGAIYFLVTEVLGIRLDVDPRVVVQRAQEYAASVGAN